MKTLTCDLCTMAVQAETFEAWMQALHPHYMEAHADVMSNPKHTKGNMQEWIIKNKTRFETA